MVAAGCAVAVLGFLDAAGVVPLFEWTAGRTMEDLVQSEGQDALMALQGGTTRGRLLSTLGNPAYVGGFLVIRMVLLGCWLIAGWEGERPPWKRAACGWAALSVMAVVLVATATREAWLGVGVGILSRFALSRRIAKRGAGSAPKSPPPRARRRPYAAFLAMLLGLVVLLVVFSTPNPINSKGWNVAGRFVELANPRSDSVRERILFYTLGGRMVSERPLLGWGPGMYGVRFYPTIEQFLNEGPYGPWARQIDQLKGRVADKAHNELIQMTVECGVMGLAALLWLIAAVLTLTLAYARHPDQGRGERRAATLRVLGSAWIAGLSTLLTSFPLHTPARALFFWTLTGLLALAIAAPQTLRTSSSAPEPASS